LESVEDADDLVHVAPDRRRVGERELTFLSGPMMKTARTVGGLAGIGVDHPVESGDGPVLVPDEWVIEALALGLGDVRGPAGGGTRRGSTLTPISLVPRAVKSSSAGELP